MILDDVIRGYSSASHKRMMINHIYPITPSFTVTLSK
jgi:hypothetical protein